MRLDGEYYDLEGDEPVLNVGAMSVDNTPIPKDVEGGNVLHIETDEGSFEILQSDCINPLKKKPFDSFDQITVVSVKKALEKVTDHPAARQRFYSYGYAKDKKTELSDEVTLG